MNQDALPDGVPHEACGGIENYSSVDLDNDNAYAALDSDLANRTNAVIEDIGVRHPAQHAALYRAFGLVSVFRFPRDNYAQVLESAKENVKIGLRIRGVWLGE